MNANVTSDIDSSRPQSSPGGAVTAAATPRLSRNAVIALSVVVLHVGFVWALQSGLLMRAAEIIVPVELLTELIEPPSPRVDPVLPTPSVPPAPLKKAIAKTPSLPAPMPLAIADPTPSPNAPVGVITPQPAPAQIAAPMAEAAAATSGLGVSPSAPAVLMPSSDADYLQNPRPPYPPISKRLGEQGKVLVRVFIGVNGLAEKAEIRQSSGFDRLDQIALSTVQKWHYVPGKRGGAAEAMWFVVPINFVLE